MTLTPPENQVCVEDPSHVRPHECFQCKPNQPCSMVNLFQHRTRTTLRARWLLRFYHQVLCGSSHAPWFMVNENLQLVVEFVCSLASPPFASAGSCWVKWALCRIPTHRGVR